MTYDEHNLERRVNALENILEDILDLVKDDRLIIGDQEDPDEAEYIGGLMDRASELLFD